MTRYFIYCALAGSILILGACKKTKFDTVLQPTGTEVASNSSIRLFNFYNYNLDITVNNIPLTTYGKPASNGTEYGLTLFPSGSWTETDNGNPFFIPSTLVPKNREVHVQISSVIGAGSVGLAFTPSSVDTILLDDPLNPRDYYALSTGHLMVVPRNTLAPILPDHFKVRVINLAQPGDPNNAYGSVTLTYSDGSSIDPALSVAPNSIGNYVDLPYGAYMFKLFVNGNYSLQLAELPTLPNLNVCTVPMAVPQEALWPQVRTFKPGATYSFVITTNVGTFQPCNSSALPTIATYNGYRIVTEQSPGPNTTYARMDAFNALPVVPLSITVDGQPLDSLLPYAGHTDYGIYVQGTHQVQAIDGSGNVLATKSITLSAYDNYTAWVYENAAGKPDICFANTDMTSTLYLTDANGNVFTSSGSYPNEVVAPVDDGTDGAIRAATTPDAWQTRFLNLTPDLPYATFTDDVSPFPAAAEGTTNALTEMGDSTSFPSASINLSPGYAPPYDPFVIFEYFSSFGVLGQPGGGFGPPSGGNGDDIPAIIRVFSSTPGPPPIVPGSLLTSVAPLSSASYIANPAMYRDPGFMPGSEPGIYTTALIGRINNTSQQDAPRLVILKHNK